MSSRMECKIALLTHLAPCAAALLSQAAAEAARHEIASLEAQREKLQVGGCRQDGGWGLTQPLSWEVPGVQFMKTLVFLRSHSAFIAPASHLHFIPPAVEFAPRLPCRMTATSLMAA